MDRAIAEAKRRGLAPVIFKVRLQDCVVRFSPTCTANRRGVPIDVTGQPSYLLCEGGEKIDVDGEW